ncbi:hypothetical protein EON63_11975 [archaeon]|nr:MAG: hypothetical protein EON63_11975 [archaeon]
MTASIETQEELAQRLTDLEEAVENLDASITERMNSMRENLLDALMQKQGEVCVYGFDIGIRRMSKGYGLWVWVWLWV